MFVDNACQMPGCPDVATRRVLFDELGGVPGSIPRTRDVCGYHAGALLFPPLTEGFAIVGLRLTDGGSLAALPVERSA